VELLADAQALARIGAGEIEHLTRAATEATFYGPPLSDEQLAANRRIATISTATCHEAAHSEAQVFVAAFIEPRFAGYVIGTRHAGLGNELDWLMVHPDFHGTPVSRALMEAGMDWLGRDQAVWLTVIQHNARAIRFYEKFGFAIDQDARTAHVVPHFIMRRAAT
jgi:ribosomal protein S18 acetylase RimI-like enzyme